MPRTPAEEFDALIARADKWLAANRADYYEILKPGATDAELDAFEGRFAIKLPAAFRQLYRWRNGQDAKSFDSIQMNLSFSSLNEIAESKETLDGMIGSDFDDPKWWRRDGLPLPPQRWWQSSVC